ncbi:MAG: recombination regulator RecX [Clostridiales bacterium]|nr:recombination regulator RecX [Clostridiales bacterium]
MKLSVKNGNRGKVHIYIDGEYRYTVDGEYWYSEKWHKLKDIDEEELAALDGAVSFRRAFNAGMNLLSYRAHGKKELVNKLVAKKHDRASAEKAVERLEELKLINDLDYAEMMVRHLEKKGCSEKRIMQELLLKGIDRDTAETALLSLDKNPHKRIIELLENKYGKYLGDEKGRKKVFNAFLRLGYSYSEINSALREFEEDL